MAWKDVVMMMMLFMMMWCGVAVVVAPAPPPLPHPTPRPDLLALTQDYWHWKTQDYPQFATVVSRTQHWLWLLILFSFFLLWVFTGNRFQTLK